MKNLLAAIAFLVSFYSIGQTNQLDASGKKHGLWKGVYEESRRPRYEGTFEHGKETGTFTYFDDTKAGSVIATREFRADGSAWTTFYDQKKNKVSEGKIVSKQYEGEWKYYHEASKELMTVEFYKNGKLDGARKVFYKNGRLAEEKTYVNGVLSGPYKKIADNDKAVVLEEAVYINGQLDGPAIYRNPDGTLASKGKFVKGEKKGTWEFYKNGKLAKSEKYPVKRKFTKLKRNQEEMLGK